MASPGPHPPAKPQFWRIQNIQLSEREVAIQWLQGEVQELAISNGSGFSIAADSERTLCATLTSHKRPTPTHRGWHVDKDFHGFTPLCDPEDAQVDIVAVMGLGGHALGSFRTADGTSVWLRDFASEDVPRARFITYGYDSKVAAKVSTQGLSAIAHTLLDGLAIFRRRTQTSKQPLCFVCHSLGGVVLKEALVISSKVTEPKYEELRQVAMSTYGLLLMGVPNLGLKHNQLKSVVDGEPNDGFVRDLLVQSDGEPSQFLNYLTIEFASLDRRRRSPFEIISYYETKTSPTIMGRFAMNGPQEYMVSKTSAERIGHLTRNIDHLPSDTDHRGLIRFEHAQDYRYRSVVDKLAKMSVEAAAFRASDADLHSQELERILPSETDDILGQPPPPPRYLPFPRNAQFVGRSIELEALERKLFIEQDCHSLAMVGLGGIGKTQVALYFAYLVLRKYPDVAVFWIPALSAETFEQAYRGIAELLGLPITANGHGDVKELVRQHLNAWTRGRWLLIVDNADDMNVLGGGDGKDGFLKHLPTSDSGRIIFTTRNRAVAQALVRNDVIRLEKSSKSEGIEILRKALDNPELIDDHPATTELLVELDYLPLAITQAAAYININDVSLSRYVQLLRSTEDDVVHLMSSEIRDSTRYEQSTNAVATTWVVSFMQIIDRDPTAAELLRYLSCIEWKAIPWTILPQIQPAAQMTSAVGTLCSYSFITRRADREMYDMHRLVHLAARVWLIQRGLLAETQTKAMRFLSNIFPTNDYMNREVWREYIPHAARMRQNGWEGDPEIRGRLCLKVGLCMYTDGRVRNAVEWLEASRDCREKLAEGHPSRLASQRALAGAYEVNGQVKEAVQLLEHVVAIEARVLAEDHPDRLASQNALARAYLANGQVKKAVELLQHVVAIQAQVLTEDHPFRLVSQYALAWAYEADRQDKEAMQLLEHVVAIEARVLAEDHPDRLASQQALALAYQTNGQFKEAVELLEHAVTIRKRVLAEEHPDRLKSQHMLAIALEANGQVKEAVELLEHVVAISRRVQAENHPDRLASQNTLAVAFRANGQVKEAVQLLEHVVAIRDRVLAEGHPSRLVSQHALAGAYQANGQVKEAVQLLEHVVAIEARVLAEDHPERLASQHALAGAYNANGQVKKAHALAGVYEANGQVKEAVQLLEHVVAIRDRVLAEGHPSRLVSQHALAGAYQANGQVKEAVQLLEHVVAIEARVLAEDHPQRLASPHELAEAYEALILEVVDSKVIGSTKDSSPFEDRTKARCPSQSVTDVGKAGVSAEMLLNMPTGNIVLPIGRNKQDNAGSKNEKWWQKWKNGTV
nr:nephrocystin-3 [Quercus suber]